MSEATRGNVWAIVLAGGEGTRLAALTRAIYGRDVPKQFAAVGSPRSFLQETMVRISSLVPPVRTLVVVSEKHARVAIEQLQGFPGVDIILQPANHGTTAGVLLPLAHVLARDPGAVVTVFPCDHRFGRESVFLAAVRRAVRAARTTQGGIVLLGAAAESAASDLGWIVPGRGTTRTGARPVRRFVEKPSPSVSEELLRRGGLWNTLVIVARGRSLWRAVRRHVPGVAEPMGRYALSLGAARSSEVLRDIYRSLPASDLSRDVLQVVQGLRVVPVIGSGWCDCGTPERLLEVLDPGEARRLRRLYERSAGARGPRPRQGGAGAPTAAR